MTMGVWIFSCLMPSTRCCFSESAVIKITGIKYVSGSALSIIITTVQKLPFVLNRRYLRKPLDRFLDLLV